jgi:hypothetical protein
MKEHKLTDMYATMMLISIDSPLRSDRGVPSIPGASHNIHDMDEYESNGHVCYHNADFNRGIAQW